MFDISIPPIRSGALLVLLGCLTFSAWASASSAADSDAQAAVGRFHHALLEVMLEADALGFDGRRDVLDPLVHEYFDLPFITRVVLGRNWKALDEAQRTRVITAVSDLTVASYASRFDGYSGEEFVTIDERELKRGRILVQTELRQPGDTPVDLEYVLQPDGDAWRIVNVVAEGISDLSLRRAEYAAIYRNGGYDALLARIDEQVVDLSEDVGN